MFDTICTLPLVSDLFCQAVHPTEPIVSVGLVSGHVQTFRLPSVNDDNEDEDRAASENGTGLMETMWKTRRHEGSCRTLGFGTDGAKLFSAGTDGLLKVADMETGRVTCKIATPVSSIDRSAHEAASLLHPLTPTTLLLATDDSALHVYDIRVPAQSLSRKPSSTHHPHGSHEYISSLTPLPPSAASSNPHPKQFLTTAGSTLAITDLRRGVLALSSPQDSELLSSVHMTGLSSRGTSTGAKALIGTADGVLTLWEHGVWDDQDERIMVDRAKGGGASLDVLTLVPEDIADKMVAVGLDDGTVRLVKVGLNKVVAEMRHDEVERVAAVGFDVGGRMVSGGGSILKVWHQKIAGEGPASVDSDEDDSDLEKPAKRGRKDSSDEDSDDSSEEETRSKKRKKRKRGKGKEKNPTGHRNGILGFKGLD